MRDDITLVFQGYVGLHTESSVSSDRKLMETCKVDIKGRHACLIVFIQSNFKNNSLLNCRIYLKFD